MSLSYVILAPTSLLPPLVPLVPTHGGLLTSSLSFIRSLTQKHLHPSVSVGQSTGEPVGKEEELKWTLYLVPRSIQIRSVCMTRGFVPHLSWPGQVTEATRSCVLLFTARLTSQETSLHLHKD